MYRGGAYYGNTAWRGTTQYAAGYNPATGTYARGATTSNAHGTTTAAQAYNPRTRASASAVQNSNAYGSSGASTASRNGNTAYAQHQTNEYGSAGSVTSTNGGKAYGASGANGSAAVGQTANGNKYATANGNVYQNTGSGWQGSSSNTPKYNTSTYSAQSTPKTTSSNSGWGSRKRATAPRPSVTEVGGWQARKASARGAQSRGVVAGEVAG